MTAPHTVAGYTAGPWVASDHHAGVGWRVESDAPGYPNDGWVVVSDMLGPDAEANARLIAAAPDLLAALESLLLYADPEGDGLFTGARGIVGVKANGDIVLKGSFITNCIRARAAIAKATAARHSGEDA